MSNMYKLNNENYDKILILQLDALLTFMQDIKASPTVLVLLKY